jgi:hypothetical protein
VSLTGGEMLVQGMGMTEEVIADPIVIETSVTVLFRGLA